MAPRVGVCAQGVFATASRSAGLEEPFCGSFAEQEATSKASEK